MNKFKLLLLLTLIFSVNINSMIKIDHVKENFSKKKTYFLYSRKGAIENLKENIEKKEKELHIVQKQLDIQMSDYIEKKVKDKFEPISVFYKGKKTVREVRKKLKKLLPVNKYSKKSDKEKLLKALKNIFLIHTYILDNERLPRVFGDEIIMRSIAVYRRIKEGGIKKELKKQSEKEQKELFDFVKKNDNKVKECLEDLEQRETLKNEITLLCLTLDALKKYIKEKEKAEINKELRETSVILQELKEQELEQEELERIEKLNDRITKLLS